MQPRACRAGGRPHPFGGLGRAQAQVVDQDDDRPMLDAEASEGAIELVLVAMREAESGTSPRSNFSSWRLPR